MLTVAALPNRIFKRYLYYIRTKFQFFSNCNSFISLQVLHLLGYAIQEELSEHYPFLSFYERSQEYGILEKLEELARCPRVCLIPKSSKFQKFYYFITYYPASWRLIMTLCCGPSSASSSCRPSRLPVMVEQDPVALSKEPEGNCHSALRSKRERRGRIVLV